MLFTPPPRYSRICRSHLDKPFGQALGARDPLFQVGCGRLQTQVCCARTRTPAETSPPVIEPHVGRLTSKTGGGARGSMAPQESHWSR